MNKKSVSKLIITEPNEELKKHMHYYNFIELLDNYEGIKEAKEVLAKSVIDDIEEYGETPIAILLSQNLSRTQNICLHIDVWVERFI